MIYVISKHRGVMLGVVSRALSIIGPEFSEMRRNGGLIGVRMTLLSALNFAAGRKF